MLIGMRTLLFTVLLGFHNALEQDDAVLEEVAVHIRIAHHDPLATLLARAGRCFFWNGSSLLN
jgi:hypothetical protein